jgi:hypothetical protein
MKKNRFSKFLLGSAGIPLMAAMAASVFFSATPNLLYAGPLNANGAFLTPVDTGNGTVNFRVAETPNGLIVMTLNGEALSFFRSRATGDQDRRLTREVDLIIEKCFPRNSDNDPTGEFTAAEIQVLLDFYNSN